MPRIHVKPKPVSYEILWPSALTQVHAVLNPASFMALALAFK